MIKKFKIRKFYVRFKEIIFAPDLAGMESSSSFYGGDKYLLFIIDVCIKYAWVKPLKDKKLKLFSMVLVK